MGNHKLVLSYGSGWLGYSCWRKCLLPILLAMFSLGFQLSCHAMETVMKCNHFLMILIHEGWVYPQTVCVHPVRECNIFVPASFDELTEGILQLVSAVNSCSQLDQGFIDRAGLWSSLLPPTCRGPLSGHCVTPEVHTSRTCRSWGVSGMRPCVLVLLIRH